ncbi:MAG: hypothetical protein NTX41_00265 [Verrucomicrobia bacterium]|nr:hypothetical protein [Verrucomicrobiota bacterium]
MHAFRLGLLFCLAWTRVQGAPETLGIPADAAGLVYVSNEVVDRTVLGQAINAAFKQDLAQNKVVRQLEEKLGIRLDADIQDLRIGIFTPAPNDPEGEPELVVLLRGHFTPARIEAFARSHQVPATTVGKFLAWDAPKFLEALTGETATEPDKKPSVLIAYSKDLLILATKAKAEATIAALNGKANSWKLPAVAATQQEALKNQWLFSYVDILKAAKPADRADVEESGIQSITLSVGENAQDLQVRLSASFIDADKAALTLLQFKALPTILDGALTVAAAGKKPEEVAAMEKLLDLIHKIQITGAGSTISAQLNYPAKEAATALLEAAKKAK